MKTLSKKLTLGKETLRTLNEKALAGVVGGDSTELRCYPTYADCPTHITKPSKNAI